MADDQEVDLELLSGADVLKKPRDRKRLDTGGYEISWTSPALLPATLNKDYYDYLARKGDDVKW